MLLGALDSQLKCVISILSYDVKSYSPNYEQYYAHKGNTANSCDDSNFGFPQRYLVIATSRVSVTYIIG